MLNVTGSTDLSFRSRAADGCPPAVMPHRMDGRRKVLGCRQNEGVAVVGASTKW